MNALEKFRVDQELSYEALGVLLGVDKGRCYQWCRGIREVPVGRVHNVEAVTGIARVALRPDIFGERPAVKPGLPSSKDVPC